MSPSSPCHAEKDTHGLFLLPPEVITKIFGNLSSFLDVFALAATCRRLRSIWSTSVIPIYDSVAPRSIACERDARRFLVDQGGLGLVSPMTAETVVQMVRNAGIVEHAILQFEHEIVWRVRAGGCSPEKFYGAGFWKHPPTMTNTERIRFIRTYYSLWGLMKLDPAEWALRLESMTLQQLYYLFELTKLTQSIGHEEYPYSPPAAFPKPPPASMDAVNNDKSDKRIALEATVRQQIHYMSQRFFQRDIMDVSIYAASEGFLWFVVLWDHWQPSLKEIVCHLPRDAIKPSPEETKQYLWDDNFDKEF